MQKKLLIFIFWLLLPFSAAGLDLKLITQKPVQGSMIIAQLVGEANVYFEGKQLTKTENNIVVFGVGRDSAQQVELTLKAKNQTKKIRIDILPRSWKIERVDGLPPSKVNPKGKAVIERIRTEATEVWKARNHLSQQTEFLSHFIKPADGRISGVYGSQRVLNGEPKRPHYGLDIANKTGTAVVAPIAGTVTLAANDYYYSGGTLILDHGHGISSTYIHLSHIDVTEGQEVKQGQKIGEIGATGRATGPHLDWRLNWFQTRLDPALLLQSPTIESD